MTKYWTTIAAPLVLLLALGDPWASAYADDAAPKAKGSAPTAAPTSGTPPSHGEGLVIPELPGIVESLRSEKDKFKEARDKFLKQQADIEKLMRQSQSKDEWNKLKGDLKDARETFLKLTKELRAQLRTELKDMVNQLNDLRDGQIGGTGDAVSGSGGGGNRGRGKAGR